MFYSNARIINASFDLSAYPGEMAETLGESARLNRIIKDSENKIRNGEADLKQLEAEWKSGKYAKIK